MVAGIILVLTDFTTLNREWSLQLSFVFFVNNSLSLCFLSTYEMISDSFETCATLVCVTFALSKSTGEDKWKDLIKA